MIKCMLVDDESAAISVLAAYIAKVSYLELVASATSSLEAIDLLSQKDVDLLFLDIQMPELNGIELYKATKGKQKVIFTTAYDQYAVEGFNVDAVDYLLKPIPFPRFLKAVQKAKEQLEPQPVNAKPPEKEFIIVQGSQKGKLTKIEVSEIDYIESIRNYVNIVCANRKILSLMTMVDLEAALPREKFVRVHRSFIVSVANIAGLEDSVIRLKRNHNDDIILGNVYRPAFMELMRSHMIG